MGIFDWVGDAVKGLSDFFSPVSTILDVGGKIIKGVSNIGGAISGPAETYTATLAAYQQAKQYATETLFKAQQFDYQASNAMINASISERNKLWEIERNKAEVANIERETKRKVGTQRAAYGALGITLEGSPQDVIADTASEGALQRALKNFASIQQQENYSVQSASFQREAGQLRQGATQARANATSILKGAEDTLLYGKINTGVKIAKAVDSLLN